MSETKGTGRNQMVVQAYLESLLEDLAFDGSDDLLQEVPQEIEQQIDVAIAGDAVEVEFNQEVVEEQEYVEIEPEAETASDTTANTEVSCDSSPDEDLIIDASAIEPSSEEGSIESVDQAEPVVIVDDVDQDAVQPFKLDGFEEEQNQAVQENSEEIEKIDVEENQISEIESPVAPVESMDMPTPLEEEEQGINCVIVLMYGLKLAIPFEDIEGMIKIGNVTLDLNNDTNWILGDFTSIAMRTHVVDTAQMLFGDNYDPIKSNYHEMLVLGGKHWSIVFDKVIKAKNIPLSAVTENPSPQFRPWLTGTYMAEKCALINVPAMVKMFEEELSSRL